MAALLGGTLFHPSNSVATVQCNLIDLCMTMAFALSNVVKSIKRMGNWQVKFLLGMA